MYQIGQLIISILEKQSISKCELIKRVGYKNIGKGLRRLDDLINNGTANDFLINNLHTALGILELEVKSALILTHETIDKERKERERKIFKPHLVIKTQNKRPSSIWACCITGGFEAHRTIQLPNDFLEMEYDSQLNVIKKIILNHYKELNGISHFFGKILGYIFCKYYDENPDARLSLNTDGDIDDSVSKEYIEPDPDKTGLFVKGRKLPTLFTIKDS